MTLKSPLYDKLKFIAQVVLPALATLVAAVAAIWGWSAAEEIVATIVAVDLFLGAVLQISSSNFRGANFTTYDGHVEVHNDGDKKVFSLVIPGDPATILDNKDQLVLRVDK